LFQLDLPDDEDYDDDEENVESMAVTPARNPKAPHHNGTHRQKDCVTLKDTIINEGALLSMDIFRPKQTSSPIIDVWWLFDDGGLTLLLPYLLRRRKRWRNCQFRIFSCVSGEKSDAEKQHLSMASLLTKFRINYSDFHVLHGLNKQPNDYETEKFNQILQTWNENNEIYRITDSEYEANKDKIKRGLKLHEYLLEYSSKSTLIVV
jgi:sodium/chloride transporter 3